MVQRQPALKRKLTTSHPRQANSDLRNFPAPPRIDLDYITNLIGVAPVPVNENSQIDEKTVNGKKETNVTEEDNKERSVINVGTVAFEGSIVRDGIVSVEVCDVNIDEGETKRDHVGDRRWKKNMGSIGDNTVSGIRGYIVGIKEQFAKYSKKLFRVQLYNKSVLRRKNREISALKHALQQYQKSHVPVVLNDNKDYLNSIYENNQTENVIIEDTFNKIKIESNDTIRRDECDIEMMPTRRSTRQTTKKTSDIKLDANDFQHDLKPTNNNENNVNLSSNGRDENRVEVEVVGDGTNYAGSAQILEITNEELLYDIVLLEESLCDKDVDDSTNNGVENMDADKHKAESDVESNKDLLCFECGLVYPTFVAYKLHMRKHTLQCFKCSDILPTYEELTKHEREHVTKYKCSQCPKRYSNAKSLKTHTLTHDIDYKSLTCPECNKHFKHAIHLEKHKSQHSVSMETCKSKQTIMCEICGKSYTKRSSLREHMMNVHVEGLEYPCNICGKIFKRKHSLWNHHIIHSNVMPFACQFCGRKFRKLAAKDRHERVHTGERPFKCRYCEKCFSDGGIRQGHEKIHQGIKDFSCEVCGRQFMYAEGVKKHMRIHTDERPYSCEYCGKAFRRSNTLKTHTRIHTGERPYCCDICGKSFAKGLYQHMLSHRTKCRLCGVKVVMGEKMDEHMKACDTRRIDIILEKMAQKDGAQ